MAEVRGQNLARAAIEVAVAGGHNVLLAGPPGIGKSMISRRIQAFFRNDSRRGHNGVLFLDELPEFARAAVEGLRQPLEERAVTIDRIHVVLKLPASFLLVAATTLCPCGWLNSGARECTCSPGRDRALPAAPLRPAPPSHRPPRLRPVPLAELRRAEPGESFAAIRARVVAARDRQLARLRPWNLRCNAEMPSIADEGEQVDD